MYSLELPPPTIMSSYLRDMSLKKSCLSASLAVMRSLGSKAIILLSKSSAKGLSIIGNEAPRDGMEYYVSVGNLSFNLGKSSRCGE